MKKQPTTQYDKFIDAVLINDVESARELIDYVDPNFESGKCLINAIYNKSVEMFELIIPYIDMKDHGTDYLIAASSCGQIEMINKLLEKDKFDAQAYDLSILNANINQHYDVAMYLMDKMPLIDDDEHEWEAIISDLATTKNIKVLEKYLNVFSKYRKNFLEGTASFIVARPIKDGLTENVKLLLKYVNPNSKRGLDYAMTTACTHNRRDIIDILYQRSDVNSMSVINNKYYLNKKYLLGFLYLESLIKMNENKKELIEKINKNSKKTLKIKTKKI